MRKLSINKGWLFIGGIVLVLFLHFVPVTACDTNNIYNKPGKVIIMAPGHKAFKLIEKHVKLTDRDASSERDHKYERTYNEDK